MNQSDDHNNQNFNTSIWRLNELVDNLDQSNISLFRSINLIRWVGYVLLILAFFDLIQLIYPPDFMNPVWEFELLGQLVERVPVPLIGFAFIFIGERVERRNLEIALLKFCSWLTLLLGILFFLLVPLGAFNTRRIAQINTNQINNQVNQRLELIEAIKEQLDEAKTPGEMQVLISQLDTQGRAPEIKDSQQVEEIKKQIVAFVDQNATEVKTQARKQLANQRQDLLKSSVKWNLGALVSGTLFLIIWRGTRWIRKGW